MNRSVLPGIILFATLLAGCGDHTPAGAPPPAAGRQTPAPTPSSSAFVPRRAAARLATWHLPYAVAREAAVPTTGRSVILAGGLMAGDRTTGNAIGLKLTSGRVTRLPPLLVPVHDTAAGLVDGRPTLVGGGNTSEQSLVQSLDHGRWRREGGLPTTRSDLEVVEWRDRAYAIGGFDGTSEPTSILRISAPGHPHRVGTLKQGVRYAAVARIHAHVFVIGGEVDGHELDTIQRIDLDTGRVRSAGRLPAPLGHAMAAAVGGRILVMGGRVSPSRQTAAMWWFDPATRRFHPAGRLPVPLSDAAVATSGHRVWLLGGETPAVTDDVTAVTLR